MNLGDKSPNEILFLNFNQDFSCVSVGTQTGYRIYNCDPFGKCYSKQDGSTGIVEMLFCTSLVALVGSGENPSFSPRQLQIINTKRQTTICELSFPTAVLAVKMNRRRLIVVLEEQIFVYDISNMNQMLRRTSMNISRGVAGSVGSYLPDRLTEMWEPTRDFASLKLPSAGVKSLVALSSTTPQVMVVTSEGFLYQYNIDLENGGECVLLKQYSLLEQTSDLSDEKSTFPFFGKINSPIMNAFAYTIIVINKS
ncbi:hypothetical protein K501DRAFT_280636 [Backusella circina FSU 941]|nr:hypothetical protein K501DRAFT_280636 [Backusella circina FSU 941]